MALSFEAGIRIRYSVARMVRGSGSADKEFDATYIAFRFDENRKWIGSTKTRIHIVAGPGDNEFTGVAKVSTLDLKDKEVATSETRLEGMRIQVEAF